MANGFQVLKYVMLDFDKNWRRSLLPDAVVEYTAIAPGALLAVVFEGATGTMQTYRYKLDNGDIVIVIGQVVHVPGHCNKQEPGNTVHCQ